MKYATSGGARRDCKRCGKSVNLTASGHLRAHKCPHGAHCERRYEDRLRGGKRDDCAACFTARQEPLFGQQLRLALDFER